MFMPPPPPPGGHSGGDVIKNEELLTEEMLELKFLNKDNASFKPTPGGFVSLEFEGKIYSRVYFHRAFPFSAPDEYISVRESEGKNKEIGMIRNLNELGETQKLVKKQLELRYFTPKITSVYKVKEEYGYSYWNTVTDRGEIRFTVTMGGNSIIKLSDVRLIITDLDGNRFEIPDTERLSGRELKMLDLYL